MKKICLPLSNGIIIYNKNRVCLSYVDDYGDKKVCVEKLKSKEKVGLFLQPFYYFFFSLYVYFKGLTMFSNEVGKGRKTGKINFFSGLILFLAMIVLAITIAIVIKYFSFFAYQKLFGKNVGYVFLFALLKSAMVYLIFVMLRFLPFMSNIFSFNGACALYLSGKDEAKVRESSFNFLNFLLNISLFSIFMVSLVEGFLTGIVKLLVKMVLFLLSLPLFYYLLSFAQKCRFAVVKDLSLITNWLVQSRPNTTQKEVMRVGKRECENLLSEGKAASGEIPMSVVIAEMTTKLKNADRFEQSDVDWIIATVLDKNRLEIKLEQSVSKEKYREIMRACERRANGEPLSNIFGFVEFYGLKFNVNKNVLSPRMETEILVDEVLKKIEEIDAGRVLDLCTGSGAIAVTLAKFADCKVYASDISSKALEVARHNAENNKVKVEFARSNLFNELKKTIKYDIIVSNPPYIKKEDIEKLDVEVKNYDPKLALDGGEDGLDFYRKIIVDGKSNLKKKGWLYFEIGQGQAQDVKRLMSESGYECVQVLKDYNNIERIIYGRIGS